MHGLWIAVSAGEGKPIYRRGRILLSLREESEKPENPGKCGKEFKPRFIVRAYVILLGETSLFDVATIGTISLN